MWKWRRGGEGGWEEVADAAAAVEMEESIDSEDCAGACSGGDVAAETALGKADLFSAPGALVESDVAWKVPQP